jgi:hypothetical protein
MSGEDRFASLRATLERYDRHVATLDTLGDDQAVAEWRQIERTLGDECARAFADATADINSRDTALLCRPCYWTTDDFLHRVAYSNEPKNGSSGVNKDGHQ